MQSTAPRALLMKEGVIGIASGNYAVTTIRDRVGTVIGDRLFTYRDRDVVGQSIVWRLLGFYSTTTVHCIGPI